MRRFKLRLCFQRFAWPDVAEGDATKSRAVLGPDRREARDEDVPEGCEGNAASCPVCDGLRFEVICCWPRSRKSDGAQTGMKRLQE